MLCCTIYCVSLLCRPHNPTYSGLSTSGINRFRPILNSVPTNCVCFSMPCFPMGLVSPSAKCSSPSTFPTSTSLFATLPWTHSWLVSSELPDMQVRHTHHIQSCGGAAIVGPGYRTHQGSTTSSESRWAVSSIQTIPGILGLSRLSSTACTSSRRPRFYG